MTHSEYAVKCFLAAITSGVSRDVIEAAMAAGWPWPAFSQAPSLRARALTLEEMMAR